MTVTTVESTARCGTVRGSYADGVAAFLGIPFAQPPIGPLRFAAPLAAQPWTGVQDALSPGPAAPQPTGGPLSGIVPNMEPDSFSEDCLSLNVWTPAADDAKRPVLVWLHGGAFSIGASSLASYDGTALATNEDVVVVSANYRLGVLGYLLLDLPGTSPNCGLLDQVMALQWVRDNIASFGGDPERVTIFGESAGGGSVLSLLSTPVSFGLYHRAIAQSGATDLVLSRDQAGSVTAAVALELGIDAGDLVAWQSVEVEALVAAQVAASAKLLGTVGMMPLHPVADGEVMVATWQVAAATGRAANVPLIIGTARDEMALFANFDPRTAHLDDAALRERIGAQGQQDPALVVDTYRSDDPSIGAPDIWTAITTDQAMWLPAVRYAEAYVAHQPDTWMYRFDWPSSVPGLGACHAIDIPFPFDTVTNHGWADFVADAGDAHELARVVQALWASFARGSDPTASGAPSWPRFSTDGRATMILNRACAVVGAPREAIRTLWCG